LSVHNAIFTITSAAVISCDTEALMSVKKLFETPAVYFARYTPFNDTNALVAVLIIHRLLKNEDEGLVSKASSLQSYRHCSHPGKYVFKYFAYFPVFFKLLRN
ncbi:hypothetical protein, partial [Phocaeicola vulgatus]|uniref:hypothetical protein n=1 Tax=Phocaeicola vulgatus TaxID=821 RepID=UPI002165317F